MTTTTTTETMTRLARDLRAISDAYTGKCTWAVRDLVSGDRASRGHIAHDDHDVMPTASLIKVPILVALYQAVADGKLRLEDRTSYREEHRTLGSGVLSKLSYGVEMTIRDAAVLMMTISDNSATNMCIDLAGIGKINALMQKLDLTATKLFLRLGDRSAGLDPRKMNVSSAADIARLFEMIARHECVSPEASEDMLRIMRRCDYRHELSLELPWNEMNMLGDDPKAAWVAEKGGSFLGGVRTSGAVFHGPRGEFVMAAFCEGGTAPGTGRNSEGNVTLGRLGKTAWDALSA